MAKESNQATKEYYATRPKAGGFVSILGVLAGVLAAAISAWLAAVVLFIPGDQLGGENGPVVLLVGALVGYAVYHRIRYRSWW